MGRLLLLVMSFGVALWLGMAAPAGAGVPTDQIDATVREVVAILENPQYQGESNAEARRALLREAVYNRFNFALMAQGTLGPKWNQFTEAQRERFVSVFTDLLERSYLDKIEGYQGERYSFVKEVQRTPKVVRVDSLVFSKGQEYKLSYNMMFNGEKWMVYDVIIEGLSLVRNYRSQFTEMLRKHSVDEMIARLESKADENNGNGNGGPGAAAPSATGGSH